MPGDQRRDDALSVCYDTVLDSPIDIVGAPEITLTLTSDRPVAMVAVRLCDVHPDGASTRITYGVLNLCHRHGHDNARTLGAGEAITISFKLDDIAYQRARRPHFACRRVVVLLADGLAVAGASEPDHPVRPDQRSRRGKRRLATNGPFRSRKLRPHGRSRRLRAGSNSRSIEHDQVSGKIALLIEDDFGEARDKDHGLIHGGVARERWEIHRR